MFNWMFREIYGGRDFSHVQTFNWNNMEIWIWCNLPWLSVLSKMQSFLNFFPCSFPHLYSSSATPHMMDRTQTKLCFISIVWSNTLFRLILFALLNCCTFHHYIPPQATGHIKEITLSSHQTLDKKA